ncbi:Fe-S oxidoreductase [Acetomicrobium mobile DSM 13181]|uniref:Fe-S oxidoreductase n=1 Tax=Acetomicrobium mobile (strain ATCC BAA-54 / DSM 13181 / JCM 12221 / NGA) TaxID=891968 RepID=I4BVR7_ACEMN|nr:radical SAM protein [Acetomicrobium mobile]AFM21374.1 Fe-S oxidoreductase [Acetomicrobium mobile DSM 13181]
MNESYFSYKDLYIEDGRKVLEVNILPEKYCNFDCVFCPIGRSQHKTDVQRSFPGTDNSIVELENNINALNPDLIFINSKGEALLNDRIDDIIDLIKANGKAVRLFTNGYLLGRSEYMKIANRCDEVVGELKVLSEEDFQRLQRPIKGYTLAEYISNMAAFRRQYAGRFIFEITIIKGCSDGPGSIEKLKDIIREISPDKIVVAKINDKRFEKKFSITDERLEEISRALLDI